MTPLPLPKQPYLAFLISGFAFLLCLMLVGIVFSYRFLHSPIDTDHGQSVFQIQAGSSLGQISRELQSKNVIRYPRLLALWARLKGQSGSIQQGEYQIADGDSPADLLAKMVVGKTIQYRVTLVEGWTFQQALAAIQSSEKISIELAGIEPSEIAKKIGLPYDHPEGALFPDTYFYSAGSSDTEILRRASEQLQKVLEQQWQTRLGALPYDSPYQALIMASIIEKESAASSERGNIAGVFIRRLELGMRLQSDPTVIYGMGTDYQGDIRRKDLQTTTPYNTYRVNGLPPTPIALAGEESIRASLHPEPGEYLYFVSQGDGTHYFSTNLEEHNAAVSRLINGSDNDAESSAN